MTHSYRRGRFWLASLALATVALIGVACGAPAAVPTPLSTPAATQAPASDTATPASAVLPGGDIPMGVDADGNFYKGSPNAAVKLTEFSDFQ